jgi:isopentenyl-diphosphate delta-isomerase
MTIITHKKIVIVDETDTVIGADDLFQAIAKRSIRRAACVWIFNERGEILLQKRSATVLEPLKYDQSVGGHVDEGESYKEAAAREMNEEINVEDAELEEVAVSLRITGFYISVYKTTISSTLPLNFNPDEIDDLLWVSVNELDTMLSTTPELFVLTCREVWQALRDKLLV